MFGSSAEPCLLAMSLSSCYVLWIYASLSSQSLMHNRCGRTCIPYRGSIYFFILSSVRFCSACMPPVYGLCAPLTLNAFLFPRLCVMEG